MAEERGRRPGSPQTRDSILEAAVASFTAQGYAQTTIRGVAREAGVDPALVMHFFGSKERLFEACVIWPFDPEERMAAVTAGGLDSAGEQVVRLFVDTWDERDGRNPIVALMRTAMSQESSEHLLRDFLHTRLLMPLVTALELDHAELRAGLVASQLLGLGAARYILRFDSLAGLSADEAVACVAPAVQRYLSDPIPTAVT